MRANAGIIISLELAIIVVSAKSAKADGRVFPGYLILRKRRIANGRVAKGIHVITHNTTLSM